MPPEHLDSDAILSTGEGGAQPASQVLVVTPDVIVAVGGSDTGNEPTQHEEDRAVATELHRLVVSRLPTDGSVRVLLCDEPEAVGITQETLADAMVAAYSKAGIGDRAEGLEHFERLLRGYEEGGHGPVRFVIIEDAHKGVWVFCDYFDVSDGFIRLGAPYAPAAAQWRQASGLAPGEHVMSKLVNTHNLATTAIDQRRARLAAGLGARVFASIVQGLANAHEDGMLLAGNAQLGTRNFVTGRLGSLLTGKLEIILDEMSQGEDGKVPQAQMVIHVLPASSGTKE